MHDYMKAIGFSQVKTQSQLEAYVTDIIENCNMSETVSLDDTTTYVEYRKRYGDGFGIAVCGEYDQDESFHLIEAYPYLENREVSSVAFIEVEKHAETQSYAGVCDDIRLGISMIFKLQNQAAYLTVSKGNEHYKGANSVCLSAMSKEGHILLPVAKSDVTIKQERKDDVKHIDLIMEAKDGNEDAIEKLTLEDIDTYTMLSRRIQTEDVLSIVDTCFMPYGIESDHYYVIGHILSADKVQNAETGETVYIMYLKCNGVIFNLCINAEDLTGEPQPGRRFKGSMWLQGEVAF